MMRGILISACVLAACVFAGGAFAYDSFLDFDYPFRPVEREIPPSVLEKIQDNDILFVGELHTGSVLSFEKTYNDKFGGGSKAGKAGRRNSLNQENLYYNLIRKFSETHAAAKKRLCLWLEYNLDSPDLEDKLNGLWTGRSHYWLINEAKAWGWSVFAVDGFLSGRNRDQFMADNIAKTIQSGECEKGISVNGHLHLSCTAEYPDALCRSVYSDLNRFPSLDKRLEENLENLKIRKSIGILRIKTSI